MYNNLDYGDSLSVFFAGEILSRSTQIERDYMGKKLSYFSAKEELRHLEGLNTKFKSEMIQFTKVVAGVIDHYKMASQRRKKRIHKSEQQQLNLADELPEFDREKVYFNPIEKWADDKFDEFVMKCSSKDQFERRAQVYFCYGRLSNRSLLMRYGMTLEYNKYDHVFMRVPFLHRLTELMKSKVNPYSYNVSKFKKFKVRRYDFNLEVLAFCRVAHFSLPDSTVNSIFYTTNLKKEVLVLNAAIQIYENYLKDNFKTSIQDNEKALFDQKLGYHEYFSAIYRLERQRLIQTQMRLCEVAKVLIQRMIDQDTESYLEVCEGIVEAVEKSEKEKNHFRYLLNPYFKRMKLNDEREQQEFLNLHRLKIEKNEEAERNRERHAAKAASAVMANNNNNNNNLKVALESQSHQQSVSLRSAEQIAQNQQQQAELLKKVQDEAKKVTVNTYKYSATVASVPAQQTLQEQSSQQSGGSSQNIPAALNAEQKKNQEDRVLRSFNLKTKSMIPSGSRPSVQLGSTTTTSFPKEQSSGGPLYSTRTFAQTISVNNEGQASRNSFSQPVGVLRPPSFAELAKKHGINNNNNQDMIDEKNGYAPVAMSRGGFAKGTTESVSRSPEERFFPKPKQGALVQSHARRTSQQLPPSSSTTMNQGGNTNLATKKPPTRLGYQKLNSLPTGKQQ